METDMLAAAGAPATAIRIWGKPMGISRRQPLLNVNVEHHLVCYYKN